MNEELAKLDTWIDLLRQRNDSVGAAIHAIDHAEHRGLPPLELHLAGNLAMEAREGATERQWMTDHLHLAWQPPLPGVPHSDAPNRLGQAIGNLMEAGLWPW